MEDIKFTNQLARRAWEHREQGIWLRPLDLNSLEYIVFHDSAWANAMLDGEPGFMLNEEDHNSGIMHNTPFDKKARKAKKENSKVASHADRCCWLRDREERYERSRLEVVGKPTGLQVNLRC